MKFSFKFFKSHNTQTTFQITNSIRNIYTKFIRWNAGVSGEISNAIIPGTHPIEEFPSPSSNSNHSPCQTRHCVETLSVFLSQIDNLSWKFSHILMNMEYPQPLKNTVQGDFEAKLFNFKAQLFKLISIYRLNERLHKRHMNGSFDVTIIIQDDKTSFQKFKWMRGNHWCFSF